SSAASSHHRGNPGAAGRSATSWRDHGDATPTGRGAPTMSQFLTYSVLTSTAAAGIAYSAPFLLAALGETIGQRSGMLNLGVEGIMLLGAFGAYYTALQTGSLWLGALVGIGVGAFLGVVTAIVNVTLKSQQGISGIGVYLFGLGLSDLLFVKLVGTPRPVNGLPNIKIPGLARIP